MQISRSGHRLHKNGDKAPWRQIGKINIFAQKIYGKKHNFKKRAGKSGGSIGSLLPMVDRDRTHSRRLHFYDLYKVILKNDLKRVKLGKAAREDLDWWLKFGATFNCKTKIEYDTPSP